MTCRPATLGSLLVALLLLTSATGTAHSVLHKLQRQAEGYQAQARRVGVVVPRNTQRGDAPHLYDHRTRRGNRVWLHRSMGQWAVALNHEGARYVVEMRWDYKSHSLKPRLFRWDRGSRSRRSPFRVRDDDGVADELKPQLMKRAKTIKGATLAWAKKQGFTPPGPDSAHDATIYSARGPGGTTFRVLADAEQQLAVPHRDGRGTTTYHAGVVADGKPIDPMLRVERADGSAAHYGWLSRRLAAPGSTAAAAKSPYQLWHKTFYGKNGRSTDVQYVDNPDVPFVTLPRPRVTHEPASH